MQKQSNKKNEQTNKQRKNFESKQQNNFFKPIFLICYWKIPLAMLANFERSPSLPQRENNTIFIKQFEKITFKVFDKVK